jgi:hypothetical protein
MKHPQGVVLLLLRSAQGALQASDYFCRVENQGQQLLEMLGGQVLLKKPLDQGAQGTRSVVDDVAQFLVFAVDVAYDVNGALG